MLSTRKRLEARCHVSAIEWYANREQSHRGFYKLSVSERRELLAEIAELRRSMSRPGPNRGVG